MTKRAKTYPSKVSKLKKPKITSGMKNDNSVSHIKKPKKSRIFDISTPSKKGTKTTLKSGMLNDGTLKPTKKKHVWGLE